MTTEDLKKRNIAAMVDKLVDTFSPNPDDVFMHQDIAAAVGTDYESNEYRSVVSSWRRRLFREKNIDMSVIRGIGYRILRENERVDAGIKNFGQSVRKMDRAVTRIERADSTKLDATHLRQHDHAKRLRELVNTSRQERKTVAINGNVVSLPKKKKSS